MSKKEGAIRVLVVDEQPIVRLGIESLLDSEPDLDVVGGVAGIRELDSLSGRVEPDVLIIDPWPEAGAALDELRRAKERFGRAEIIIYTSSTDRSLVVSALEAGVRGYLLKRSGMDELVAAIRKIHEGCAVLADDVANQLVVYMNRQQGSRRSEAGRALTERELEVLTGMAQGQSNRAIGAALFICEATVKFHVHAILAKLNVGNRTEAVLVAARDGLIDLDTDVRRKTR
jgi:DNA-binding NarL/FixJ family response regulator